MNPKKIEKLDPATNLQDDDLLFASVREGGAIYASKKVTLKDIADYVRNGTVVVPGGSESGFGGYEMIDTSEGGNGIYDASTIQSYVSDRSKNFLWGLSLGVNGIYDVNEPFEKELGKDCTIWIDGFNTEGTAQGETQVFLNGVRLYNLTCLRQGGLVFLYAKAGQTVKIQQTGLVSTVYIVPLASGGKYFFDTSDQTKFKRGVLKGTGVNGTTSNWYMNDNNFIERADGSNHIKVTAPYPLLFAGDFILNRVTGGFISTINGKQILYAGDVGYDGGSSVGWYICLQEGDVFETDIASNVGTYWLSYPLLVNESEHGSGSSEDKSCGYVQYDTEETDNPDFGSYEDNEELNYIQGLTIGSGSANLPKLEKTFSKDCEVLLRFSPELNLTKNSKSHVKIGNITIPTMLAFGEYGLYDMKLYVKKGQTLNVDPQTSMKITVFVNPLKSGGEFFIDGNADLESIYDLELTNNFESYNFYSNGPFEFTAPQKTLFIYRGGTDTINTWQNNVTINGMKVPVRRYLCSYVTTDSSGNPVVNNHVYLWNRFILEERDKLKFNITSSNGSIFMYYNILPLLEN